MICRDDNLYSIGMHQTPKIERIVDLEYQMSKTYGNAMPRLCRERCNDVSSVVLDHALILLEEVNNSEAVFVSVVNSTNK